MLGKENINLMDGDGGELEELFAPTCVVSARVDATRLRESRESPFSPRFLKAPRTIRHRDALYCA